MIKSNEKSDNRRTQALTFESDKKDLEGERSWKLDFDDIWRIEDTEIKVKITVLNSVLSQEDTVKKVQEGIDHIKKLYDAEVKKYQLMHSDVKKPAE